MRKLYKPIAFTFEKCPITFSKSTELRRIACMQKQEKHNIDRFCILHVHIIWYRSDCEGTKDTCFSHVSKSDFFAMRPMLGCHLYWHPAKVCLSRDDIALDDRNVFFRDESQMVTTN